VLLLTQCSCWPQSTAIRPLYYSVCNLFNGLMDIDLLIGMWEYHHASLCQ